MRVQISFTAIAGWLAVCLCLLPHSSPAAPPVDPRFESYLVWATDADKSPNPDHKPVTPEVRRKLKELPLRWKNFFEVNRQTFAVPRGGSVEVRMSDKCSLRVTDVDGKHFEVSLIGQNQPVLTRTQPLPVKEMLVVGGNAPDETGWLVVMKRIE
jgi:hypothetical protein